MALTSEQRLALDRDGYVAPLRLCSPERMEAIRVEIDDVVTRPGPFQGDPWSARHQDCAEVLRLCADPSITDAVAEVLGPDVVVWNSVLMHKAPGDGEIPWHQDQDFEYLEPDIGLAVWLAIDEADRDNGCLQVIPGTHTTLLPAVARTRADEFDTHVEGVHTEGRAAVTVELRAGEFMLFNNKILHRSAGNSSARRRLGLAVRYTVPDVTVRSDRLFDGHRTMPVRGGESRRQAQ